MIRPTFRVNLAAHELVDRLAITHAPWPVQSMTKTACRNEDVIQVIASNCYQRIFEVGEQFRLIVCSDNWVQRTTTNVSNERITCLKTFTNR